MKKRIVIYQKNKEIVSKQKLARMSNTEIKRLHRRTYLFEFEVEGDKVKGDFKVSSCSPFDQFTRKRGLEVAIEKFKSLPFTCNQDELRGVMSTFIHYFESGKGTSLEGLAAAVLNNE